LPLAFRRAPRSNGTSGLQAPGPRTTKKIQNPVGGGERESGEPGERGAHILRLAPRCFDDTALC
jgi:hypothetical protein